MIRMPSDTFRGPLPPLTEEQQGLEQELRLHVQQLAGTIGERNLFRYQQLLTAADYIGAGMPPTRREDHAHAQLGNDRVLLR